MDCLSLVCDATASGRATAAEVAPGVPVTEEVEAVLASDVSGVVIATPAETHYELARRALEAGKDVFVEKPLALTYEQGSRLVGLSQQHRPILMVGHVLEYHPAIVRLNGLVRDGVLGKVQDIYSNRLSLGEVRREENILWSFAPHDIAVILRLMGTMPFRVVACGGSYVQPNIPDVTITGLLFDNGVRAHIHVSWLDPFREQRLVVIGQKKMASLDDVDKKLVLFDRRVDVKEGMPVPFPGHGEEVEFGREEPLRLECQAFLRAITTRRPHYQGERELGLFAAVASLMAIGATFMSALWQAATPRLANDYHEGRMGSFWRLCLRLFAIGAVLGAAGVVAAAIAGREILTLMFRPESACRTDLLIWVMITAAVQYTGGTLSYAVMAMRRFWDQMPVQVACLVATVLLCAALVPRHGSVGAIWAQLIAYVVSRLGFVLLILRDLPGMGRRVPTS